MALAPSSTGSSRDAARTRALVATLGCGDLVIDVQMYFSPSAIAKGEELITPYMRDIARGFIDGSKAQCAGG